MKCKAHVLRDVPEPLTAKRWEALTFRIIRETPELAHGLGAFTTVRSHPDGHVYCGTTAFDSDILYRFIRETATFECLDYPAKAEFLGKPLPKWRMPALVCGEYDVHVVTYERKTARFADLGRVIDTENDMACYMPHDLTLTADGVAYIGETDHPERSGYLWECS